MRDSRISDSHYGRIALSFKSKQKDYNELVLNIPKHNIELPRKENWLIQFFKKLLARNTDG